MSDIALSVGRAGHARHRPKLDAKPPKAAIIVFLGLLAAGAFSTLSGLTSDISDAGGQPLAISALVLLAIALLIALGFEFVNGFHDTANAVATVTIIGVGLANQLMDTSGSATSGVDLSQVMGVFKALLFSPLVGFAGSALLLIVMKMLFRQKKLYEPPDTSRPPPIWIRSLLILTCTGVSFAHGSNDGQKGMGLIMLILIGAAPTAYALNRTLPADSHARLRRDHAAGARPVR